MKLPGQRRRQGTVLPLFVLSIVAVCGFVALAVDIGLIALAKTQLQNAVDAGAMAGARSLDGSSTQNLGALGQTGTATNNAQVTTQANLVLGDTINGGKITLLFGAWHYDTTNQLFTPQFPPVSPDNYNLCQVTATYNVSLAFAPVFSLINHSFQSLYQVSASSQAAHRPRDVALVLDFSGSMNNESDLWNNESYLDSGSTSSNWGYKTPSTTNPNFTSNNTETVYPLFGHYSNEKNYGDYFHYANLLSPAADSGSSLYGNSLIGKSNVSQTVLGMAAQVNDFYQNNRGSSAQTAFTSYPDSYANGTDPNQGDNYLPMNGQAVPNYAANVKEIVPAANSTYDATWETQGYDGYYASGTKFKGYTLGPRYWGKTFFIWPPDPRSGKDWRTTYFLNSSGTAGCNDNTALFATTGDGNSAGPNDPAGNYQINYKAILNWIKNTGSNPFPSQLRSGNILYYSSIPSDVPASAYDHTQANSNISNVDQRFWKEYIDWTLGVWRDPAGNIQHTQNPSCSMGPDFRFTLSPHNGVTINAPPAAGSGPGGTTPYMNYLDNPWRPRHRMWFGPMTMIQFMMDTGLLSGVTHDISMFPMKQGVGCALLDIQNNHPNDLVAMLPFSRPQYSNDPSGTGKFNNPQYNLTNTYSAMVSSLWVPPNSSGSDVRPWDSNGIQTPSAHGDYDANTASDYGFMLAYNQFSGNTSLQTAGPNNTAVGGLGRKGATRLVIYETDGMANQNSNPTAGFSNLGVYNSYYTIRPGDTVNSTGYDQNALLQVVEAICNKDDGTVYAALPSGYPTPPSYPGYATTNKPVIVQCVAFGAIFENSNSTQTSAVTLLQEISTIGGTVFPSSSTDATYGYKWCIGTLSQRQSKLQQAILNFLDSSVPVSLIQ
jgi:Flp pilus assembly protein TadG